MSEQVWIWKSEKFLITSKGRKEVHTFICPTCATKWNFFWYPSGVHALKGSHQCKNCKIVHSFDAEVY